MADEEFNINLIPDQGLAFLEALTGLEPDGRGNTVPKSTHARTTLAAILGQTGLPLAGDVVAWSNKKPIPGYPKRLKRFVQYLRAVSDALEKLLPREDQENG